MTTGSTLTASTLSVALGAANTSSLMSLKSAVDELKLVMTRESTVKSDSLFGSKTQLGTENLDVDALSTRVENMNSDMVNVYNKGLEAVSVMTNINEITKNISELTDSIKESSFDIDSIMEITPSTVDFVGKWDIIGQHAYVDQGKSMVQIKDCNIGLVKNNGYESAIHFAGVDDPNWSMYTSSSVGTSTDEKPPPTHSGVTGTAIRMRVGNGGVIIETPQTSLLHIESDGRTNIASTASGNLDSSSVAGFSHMNRHNTTDFAVCQEEQGATKINSSSGYDLILGSNNIPSIVVKSSNSNTMDIKNYSGVDTLFNSNGTNVISSTSATRLRSGASDTDNLLINSQGASMNGSLYIDDISVTEMIRVLKVKLTNAEKKWRTPM